MIGKLTLILYPLNKKRLGAVQKKYIIKTLGLEPDFDFEELRYADITDEDLTNAVGEVNPDEKADIFKTAYSLAEHIFVIDFDRMVRLAEVLSLNAADTGLDYDIFDSAAITDRKYEIVSRNYSCISAAIGFIPFVPVADFFVLTPLQVVMCNQIFAMYNFDCDTKEFLKTVGAAVGQGLLMRLTSKLFCSLIPGLGWVINASVAFTGTYIIGRIAREYAMNGGTLSSESIQAIWCQANAEAKREFPKMKDFIFDCKDMIVDAWKSATDIYKEAAAEEDAKDEADAASEDIND